MKGPKNDPSLFIKLVGALVQCFLAAFVGAPFEGQIKPLFIFNAAAQQWQLALEEEFDPEVYVGEQIAAPQLVDAHHRQLVHPAPEGHRFDEGVVEGENIFFLDYILLDGYFFEGVHHLGHFYAVGTPGPANFAA